MKKHRKLDTNPTDNQVGGDHYKLPIQPTEYIYKNNLDYLSGNVVKYITRWNKKHDCLDKQLEDIDKAIHYCQLLKQLVIETEDK